MKRLRSASSLSSISLSTSHALLVAAVMLCLVAAPLDLCAQAGRGNNHDVITNKFQPSVSPESLAPARPAGMSKTAIAPSALAQIHALQLDKMSRTATQKKISSKLIRTARMLQGQPAAPGVPFLRTGVEVDANNNLLVDIIANFTDDFLDKLRATGAQVLNTVPHYRSVQALVPANKLETIAAWPNVIAIAPKRQAMTTTVVTAAGKPSGTAGRATGFEERAARVRNYLASLLPAAATSQRGTSAVPGTPAPTGQGSKTTEGDLTHRAFDARQAFGVTGSGLKIGVISDGVTNLAASQALGDLANVTVLPGQTGSGDEGTAMLEIIHDMAPGAALFFATADPTVEQFAQNIHDLRTAGCDIIVDDVFYFIESPFVDGQTDAVTSEFDSGLILQAVNDVTADGALYFSSAGNEGNVFFGTAGIFEGDFVDGGPLAVIGGAPSGDVHNFGTADSPLLWDQILAPGFAAFLFWSDPLGASNNDYDLYLLNPAATAVVEVSDDVQDGTQDPVEAVDAIPGDLLVVALFAGSPRFLHLNTFRGELAVFTNGETHGHNHAALAYSVAATPAASPFGNTTPGPYPNFFTTANQIESFSSDGPRHLFYNADGTPITPGDVSSTGGLIRQKPDITAADGVTVTGVGGFGSPFYGTSAAAPSAAAVAALVKSAKPSLTPDEIRTALTSTAVDIMDEGVDIDSGAGIVMAFEAVNSLGVTGSANPELGDISATDNPGNGNGFLEAGEGGILTIHLKNIGGVKNAVGITGTLTTSTAGVTITQPGTSTFPNMPALSAAQVVNANPLTFTLASNFPCGQTITFTLTLTYQGGPTPRALTFTVPTGPQVNISGAVGTPGAAAGITAETGIATTRIFRTGTASACAAKAFPGTSGGAGNRAFDGYQFMATHNTCTAITMTALNGVNLFTAAYSPNVVPTNLGTNYVGDAGLSGSMQTFGLSTTSGHSYELMIEDVPILTTPPSGNTYNLNFSGCAFTNLVPNHPPVAKAKNVTVAVGAGGAPVAASINNGSFDPDGDPITITQSPPGPYALGSTNVLLTVVDTFGATSQATGTVTVVTPSITVVAAAASSSVAPGGTADVTFTISGNVDFTTPATTSCTTSAPLTTCTFTTPANFTVLQLPQTIVAHVHTTGTHASNRMPVWPGRSKAVFATLLGMPMFVFMVPLVDRRRNRKHRMVWPWVAFLLLALLLAGCGSSSPAPFTTPGTYPVQVTVSDAGTSGSATIVLDVGQ